VENMLWIGTMVQSPLAAVHGIKRVQPHVDLHLRLSQMNLESTGLMSLWIWKLIFLALLKRVKLTIC
jgi:hypothetical protein